MTTVNFDNHNVLKAIQDLCIKCPLPGSNYGNKHFLELAVQDMNVLGFNLETFIVVMKSSDSQRMVKTMRHIMFVSSNACFLWNNETNKLFCIIITLHKTI